MMRSHDSRYVHYSITPDSLLAEMLQSLPRVYPLLGLAADMRWSCFSIPCGKRLRDGFRCIGRFKRIWVTFVLLGFAYFIFQFATFTPIRNWADLDPIQSSRYRTGIGLDLPMSGGRHRFPRWKA